MQLQTGNLFGTVVDDQGGPLPGVTIILEGGGAQQVQVTDPQGRFRFMNVMPGSHAVRAELDGFSTVTRPAAVGMGRNTEIEITLRPATNQGVPASP